jgi:hypothetical protein
MKLRIAPWRAIVLAGLISLNFGLAAIAASALLSGDAPAAVRVAWTPPVATAGTAPPDAKPIARYQQTLAHPIFFKTREPFVPPPPAPPPPPPAVRPSPPAVVADPGLVLGGILVMQGVRKAYLFRKTDPSGSWVAHGGDFMGWKIQAIDAAGIVLGNGDRTIDLKLYPER